MSEVYIVTKSNILLLVGSRGFVGETTFPRPILLEQLSVILQGLPGQEQLASVSVDEAKSNPIFSGFIFFFFLSRLSCKLFKISNSFFNPLFLIRWTKSNARCS